MRVPYRWLQEYVDVDEPPQQLARRLTALGLEVERVEELADRFSGCVVGRVLEVAPHPDTDDLKVVTVAAGAGELTVVCGAPEIPRNEGVAVALPGARLAGGIRVEARSVGGVTSQAVLCSPQELGLETGPQTQVQRVPGEFAPGTELAQALGYDDSVLVLELTPNYAQHCQSMLGVAREVAAATGAELKPPPTLAAAEGGLEDRITVTLEDPVGCPRYTARMAEEVAVAASPPWLQQRLRAAGVRPISNVVDVTNYVMLELGHPLHAFDYRFLMDAHLIIRRARDGEPMRTLDGELHALTAGDVVIADPAGPQALGGIMGGVASEVRESTPTILLEAAYFDPTTILRSSRRLGLRTQSSIRFEKGIDPGATRTALDRACYLLKELGAAVPLPGSADRYPEPVEPRTIRLQPPRVNQLLGLELPQAQLEDQLTALGLEVAPADDVLEVTVPTRRPDLALPEDLVEEIARHHGYENIPARLPAGRPAGAAISPRKRLEQRLAEAAVAAGLQEVITPSFFAAEALDRLRLPAEHSLRRTVRLKNPMSRAQAALRTLLAPLMLDVLAHNARQGQEGQAVFEMSRVYRPDEDAASLPAEPLMLAGALAGPLTPVSWQDARLEADFYAAKGVVERLLGAVGLRLRFAPCRRPWLHPGRAAEVAEAQDGLLLGWLGEVHPAVAAAYELDLRCYLFEVDLELVARAAELVPTYQPLSRQPAVRRDIAFYIRRDVPAARVAETIRRAAGSLLESLTLFDVYAGDQVPEDAHSLAYQLVYRHPERTLTDAEVEAVQTAVREALVAAWDVELRS